MSDELKRCPNRKCRSAPTIVFPRDGNTGKVVCQLCAMSGPDSYAVARLVDHWNALPRPADEREAVVRFGAKHSEELLATALRLREEDRHADANRYFAYAAEARAFASAIERGDHHA